MKVLITGGAGFIGKWLVRELPESFELVVVDSIDQQVHKAQTDFSEEMQSRALCIKADVRDKSSYAQVLDGVDVVVHLASQTGTGQSMYEISKYVQHNVDGTAKLLEAISELQHKPRRIVLTSSRAIYGEGAFSDGSKILYGKSRKLEDLQAGRWETYSDDGCELSSLAMNESHLPGPTSIYGLTKLWQEDLFKNYAENQGIDYAIFRLQNVYGPEQELRNPYTGIIGIFTSLITQKGEVELFEDGKMTRDFVYVRDVAHALARGICDERKLASTLNVGSGQPTSLEELVNTIAKLSSKTLDIKYSGRFRVGDVRHATADMNFYKQVFSGWKPTSLEEGIRSYLDWYQSQNPLSEAELSTSFKEMEEKKLLLKSE